MKFKVDRLDFHKAITRVEGIISTREIRSVISNILIEVDNNTVTLTATDLELGIKTTLPAEIQESGTITLPAKKLSQSIREFRGAQIQIESDTEHKVSILDASGVSRARIMLMGASSEEYPVIPTLTEKKFMDFSPALAIEMIRKTSHSMAEEDARYVFNGLFLKNDGPRVSIVGTDGRRLSQITREFPAELPFKDGIIIPAKAVRELIKLIDASETGKIAYEENDKRIYFRLGNVDLITKLIEGQYPDYQQVIPKKLESKENLNRENFANSLRQVSVMAAEPSRQVRMTFNTSSLTIAASTPDLGEAQDSLDSAYKGEELTLAFNSNYVMDVIKVLNSEEITLGFSSASAPAVILDPDDKDFISVVMPMKV